MMGRVLGVGIIVFGVLVPAALAQTGASLQGYGGVAGGTQGALGQTGSAGTLPFTGLDLGLLVAGAVILLIAGFAVRRFARGQA